MTLSAWLLVPSLSFLNATIQYFNGTASIKGVGGPETYHGIDRETRVASVTSGCILVGYEPFVFSANNLAIKLWTALAGYQRDSYTGVFPTEEEAIYIVKTAPPLKISKVNKYYEIKVADRIIKIDTLDLYRYHYTPTETDIVSGAVINNECLVFQKTSTNDRDYSSIYLLDIRNSRILTRYYSTEAGSGPYSFSQTSFDPVKISNEKDLNFAFTDKRGIRDDDGTIYLSEKDGVTISAYRGDSVLWKVNVIQACHDTFTENAIIRAISLKDGVIDITFGKHSYATLETSTAKVRFWGAD